MKKESRTDALYLLEARENDSHPGSLPEGWTWISLDNLKPNPVRFLVSSPLVYVGMMLLTFFWGSAGSSSLVKADKVQNIRSKFPGLPVNLSFGWLFSPIHKVEAHHFIIHFYNGVIYYGARLYPMMRKALR